MSATEIPGGRDPDPADRIVGWKSIAAALGVSIPTATGYADPHRVPRLPVRKNFKGEVYVTRWNLQCWVNDNDVPYGIEKHARG